MKNLATKGTKRGKGLKSNYEPIGNFIQPVDECNGNLRDLPLVGLSISKEFIPSVANIIGTDLSNYKVIKKNQFACSLMQVSRDGKMPVAMFAEDEAIMSPAYPLFEVMDEKKLLPEYLMMWFSRSEFDREAAYYAVGGVRGNLPWEDFLEMKVPVPKIETQRAIVAEYNALQNRIIINQKIIQKLEETAQAIYKEWFVDNKDEGWEVRTLSAVADIKAGGDKPDVFSEEKTEKCQIPIYSNSSVDKGLYGYTDEATISNDSITISARGAIIGYTVLRTTPFVPIVRLIVVTPKKANLLNYIYDTIKNHVHDDNGSAQGQLTIPDVSSIEITIPDDVIIKKYQKISSELTSHIEQINQENQKLNEFKTLLLSKLASVV